MTWEAPNNGTAQTKLPRSVVCYQRKCAGRGGWFSFPPSAAAGRCNAFYPPTPKKNKRKKKTTKREKDKGKTARMVT
jgi:hypothetical protein